MGEATFDSFKWTSVLPNLESVRFRSSQILPKTLLALKTIKVLHFEDSDGLFSKNALVGTLPCQLEELVFQFTDNHLGMVSHFSFEGLKRCGKLRNLVFHNGIEREAYRLSGFEAFEELKLMKTLTMALARLPTNDYFGSFTLPPFLEEFNIGLDVSGFIPYPLPDTLIPKSLKVLRVEGLIDTTLIERKFPFLCILRLEKGTLPFPFG
eukprot:TRINITY_DN13850_c0_g1_i2.p1 TRINITY_DN13850_c0_g1~~TRINITY_DN13850_c0_g1_i2.p1  ORF type:complete len:209 (+),score=26.30 TRINITY_DN13850_c0_g1_i2:1-627(+)